MVSIRQKQIIRLPLILLVLLFYPVSASGQFYNTGQAPSNVRWNQINTLHFQLIFPEDFYQEANRAANILEFLYKEVSADYEHPPKKISIILYNQSVLSNGFVAWAPKRAEWITTPPQESYAQNWIEQLSVHEFRHVVQLDNLESGFTQFLKYLFGEAATGAVSAYLPLWFLEGDAVLSETEFSLSGRGRLAEFDREIRTIELDRDRRFSYDQSYLGSYNYYIPSYYNYGYQMVTYGKLKYGNTIWGNTVSEVGRKPYLFAPFYFGMRKSGVRSKRALYNNTFDSLKILWNNTKYIKNSIDTLNFPNCSQKHFTNYTYPQPAMDGIFTVRSGIDDITRFVILHDGMEDILFTPGRYSGGKVSVNNRYAVWEEVLPDTRWAKRNYSVLKLLDLKTKKVILVSRKSRYFSPCLLNSGNKLVCVEVSQQNEYYLVIINIPSGYIEKKIPVGDYSEISSPVWLNEEELAFIALNAEGESIVKTRVDTIDFISVFNAGFRNIEKLQAGNEKLFFTYDYELSRNIYCFDTYRDSLFRVTHSRHGTDYPFVDPTANTLYFSDYSLTGYKPFSISLDSLSWEPAAAISSYTYTWANALTKKSDINIQNSEIPDVQYKPDWYSRFDHSFTLHSWAPFYFDPEEFLYIEPAIYPGFCLFSQNKLSTLTSSFSYYYRDQSHYLNPKITWEGFYPVIEVSALFKSRPEVYFWPGNIGYPESMQTYYNLTIESYLPINLTWNKFTRYLRPGMSFRYLNRYYYSNHGAEVGYNIFGVDFYGSNLLKQSLRDIRPRFGQTIYLSYYFPIKHADIFSSVITAAFNQYLPGLFNHHSLLFTIAYEKNNENKVPLLNNQINLPRGYADEFYFFKNRKVSAEYTMPLVYPDISIGPLAYIKRIHATYFLDMAGIVYPVQTGNNYTIGTKSLLSTGMIIASEMHFFRFIIPFTPSLRIAYLPNEKSVDFRLYISADISSF